MDSAKLEKMIADRGMEVMQDSARIKEAWTKARKRASEIPQDKEHGTEARYTIITMLSMLQDYLRGDYKEISKHSLAMLVGTLVYCASPIDLIPDPIPAIGLSDDVALIIFAASTLLADIIAYQNWRKAQNKPNSMLNEYLDEVVGSDPAARQKEIDRLAGIYDSMTADAAVRQERG